MLRSILPFFFPHFSCLCALTCVIKSICMNSSFQNDLWKGALKAVSVQYCGSRAAFLPSCVASAGNIFEKPWLLGSLDLYQQPLHPYVCSALFCTLQTGQRQCLPIFLFCTGLQFLLFLQRLNWTSGPTAEGSQPLPCLPMVVPDKAGGLHLVWETPALRVGRHSSLQSGRELLRQGTEITSLYCLPLQGGQVSR